MLKSIKFISPSVFFLVFTFISLNAYSQSYEICMQEATQKCYYTTNSNGYHSATACMEMETQFCEVDVTGYYPPINDPLSGWSDGGTYVGVVDRTPQSPAEREREREKCNKDIADYYQQCKMGAMDAYIKELGVCDGWINAGLAITGGGAAGGFDRRIGVGRGGLMAGTGAALIAKGAACQVTAGAVKERDLASCDTIFNHNQNSCNAR